jgi:hypothetical protein
MFRTQTAIFRITIFFLLTGVLMSYRLWVTDRNFPLLPLLEVPQIPALAGYIIFATVLLILLISFFKQIRFLVIVLVILLIFMIIQDQARLQPWVYHYFLFFIPFCFRRKDDSLSYFQFIMIGIYLWGGINKMNPYFTDHVFPEFVYGLTNYHLQLFKEAGYLIPVLEVAIAIGLFFTKTRKWAVLSAYMVHVLIILFLSPLGSNINSIVIPWNIAMMLFLYSCFSGSTNTLSLTGFFKQSTHRIKPIIVTLYLVLPVLGFWGMWDYYLSFNLYSGKGPVYQIMVAKNEVVNLPYDFSNAYMPTPNLKDSKIIDIYSWSVHELRVPLPPEKRLFKAIAEKFCQYGIPDEDLIYLELERPIHTGDYFSYTCSQID